MPDAAPAAPLSEAEYHAHPALSYSVGKVLLRSPLHYRHALTHREETTEFDVGHAIHALVLGVGADIVEIPYDSYRTQAARDARDEAYAAGKTPVKTAQLEPVRAAAEAVLSHPTARSWLELPGDVEVPLFATDPGTGVEIRGKLDKLADLGGRPVPVDLKTVTDAREGPFFRAVRDYDYDLQAALYRHLVQLAGLGDPTPAVVIAAEKVPPHDVAVFQLSHEDIVAAGELKLRTVLARAKALRDQPDAWPGYPLGTRVLTPTTYYLTDLQERFEDPS